MNLEDLSFEILNNDARSLIQKRLMKLKLDKKDISKIIFEVSKNY